MVIPEILDQHAEEAAFLWLLRDAAATAPHYTAQELAELDERVEAHLDGLRIADEAGWSRCLEELEREEPGEVFAAGVLAIESGEKDRLQCVLRVAEKDRSLGRALISALGWVPLSIAQPAILYLLQSEKSERLRIGLRGAAAHRWDSGYESGPLSLDSTLHAAELRTWAELGRIDRLRDCRRALDSPDPQLRFWAAWSCVLLGDSSGLTSLRETARFTGSYASRALEVVSLFLCGSDAWDWHAELAASSETERSAIRAAGMMGDPALVPWLLERVCGAMVHRRVAAEAVSSILGWDFRERPLLQEQPADFEPLPNDDPADDNVTGDLDADLPWPDPDAALTRWAEESVRFSSAVRWVRGEAITEVANHRLLVEGSQRQRWSAALELVLRHPGKPLPEIRARQRILRE